VKAPPRPLLEVRDLTVEYSLGSELFGGQKTLRAADRLSFSIQPGKTLALVGESGSGKSTAAKAIAGLAPISAGSILFEGHEITSMPGKARRMLADSIQMLFQDPYGSLNPRRTAGQAVWEAPTSHRKENWRENKQEKTLELFKQVGLHADTLGRYPHEFSGGQRQRIALARALAMNPVLLILDEPTSALDVSMAAQVLNLLSDLQQQRNLTYLMIGHDLALMEKAADNIAVMYASQIVEIGPAENIICQPRHPYTRMLLETARGKRTRVPPARGQIAGEELKGCRFADRCRDSRQETCPALLPQLTEVTPGHLVRCPYC
jgi:oligopeptide/dipeptide ABC transporter ATP-binding protein